jgi:hypothetical protein
MLLPLRNAKNTIYYQLNPLSSMKFGIRKPSLTKSIAARTSSTRLIKNALGFKVPRGWGWITNPKRAAYNKVYNKTTYSFWDIIRKFLE